MRVSLKDHILFIKQLATFVRAGVPLFSSLAMLKKNSKSRTMNKIMDQVVKDVENGQYLATTLAKFKKFFGELTISVIAVGEASGTLANNLDHLVLSLKKKQGLKRKVVGASVYPIFIIIATIAITIMLTVFIFPKIIPVFQSINYDLPWTTHFLIFLNNAIRNYWVFIVSGLVIVIVGIWLLLKVKKVHFWYDKALLSVPLIGTIVRTYNAANVCRTLGLLLSSGTPVVRTFNITSNTTGNILYKEELNKIADKITKGEKISDQLYSSPKLFPSIMAQMVSVGESTGKLSDTFLYLADIYEEEMDDITKNLSTTVEPMLLILMGILVGFIAISIITPIYGITQHLNPR